MREIYRALGGEHSFKCENIASQEINHIIYLENPYKLGDLGLEDYYFKEGSNEYISELSHYIRKMIEGSPFHCTAIAVPEELVLNSTHEFLEVKESILPQIASKRVAKELVENSEFLIEKGNYCRACYTVAFATNMLYTGDFLHTDPVKVSNTNVYSSLREKFESEVVKQGIQDMPNRIEINKAIKKIREDSSQFF